MLTAGAWVYFANLFIAYPVGLAGLFFWYQGRKMNPASLNNKIALVFFIAGFVVSIAALFFYK